MSTPLSNIPDGFELSPESIPPAPEGYEVVIPTPNQAVINMARTRSRSRSCYGSIY